MTIIAGNTGQAVSHRIYTLDFDQTINNPAFYAQDQQSFGFDTASTQLVSLTNQQAQFRIQEEQSADVETAHANEIVGWVVVGEGTQNSNLLDGPTVDSHEAFTIAQPDEDTWTRVEFADSFDSPPVVIPSLLSSNDLEPAVTSIGDISTNSVELQTAAVSYTHLTLPTIYSV